VLDQLRKGMWNWLEHKMTKNDDSVAKQGVLWTKEDGDQRNQSGQQDDYVQLEKDGSRRQHER